MYESIAHGGPLNGVRLRGPLEWDGKIPLRDSDRERLRKTISHNTVRSWTHHPGRYVWSDQTGWTWRDGAQRLHRSPKRL